MTSETAKKFDEAAIVGLISIGHFFSHFFILSIPAVLPLIRAEFDTSFFVIGLIMATYAGCSAIFQYPAGALLDKLGARYFVIGGLLIESLAIVAMGFAPNVLVMLALAAIAGTADSVFHPADYAVITARVRQNWLGKSYGFHTFAGFLGFAAAPTAMIILLSQNNNDWRTALMTIGAVGACFSVVLFLQRSRLGQEGLAVADVPAPSAAGMPKIGLKTFLTSTPVVLMFAFYIATSLAGNGIQSFSNSALISLYSLTLDLANLSLASYLWGIAAGVLVGGIVADQLNRFDMIALVGYLVAASLLVLVASGSLPFIPLAISMFFAGFMLGAVMPSRDLMVKAVAPPGAVGQIFGFVSTGFGIGGFLGPLLYGSIMDTNQVAGIFLASAFLMLVTIGFAVAAGRFVRPEPAAQPAE